MDKQLLKALGNIGDGLEALVDALNNKKEGGSDTTKALTSGDFGGSLEQISTDIKSIKVDTQEILKNQQTIIELQKQKSSDKKTEAIEGDDPKKQSSIKKGLTTILLIAVAVLAIGLAFKLVGKIDFLSVVGLSIAIVLVAIAFERVAKLDLSPKKAAFAALAMVIMSAGVMISSFFLSKVSPISIGQVLTSAAIALLFYFVGPTIASMISALESETTIEAEGMGKVKTKKLSIGKLIATAVFLPLLMAGMSLGILVSSKILSGVKPLSIGQIITSILISGMFMMVASGIKGLIHALTEETEVKAKGFGGKQKGMSIGKLVGVAVMLPIIMLAISVGIWLSSMILSRVQPIGFMQALSAIAIAAIFTVAAFGISSLIKVLGEIPPQKAILAAIVLPLILPAMALSITLSSFIFAKITPVGFMQLLTAIAIAVVFVILSFGMKQIVKAVGEMKWTDIPKIPVFFALMSLSIGASALILNKFKKDIDALGFMTILKVLVIGAALGVIAIIAAVAVRIMKGIDWKTVIMLPVFFVLIAAAITGAALIFSKFQKSIDGLGFMTILKILVLGIAIAVVALVFVIIMKIFKIIGIGVTDAIKGGLVILIIAATLAQSSNILNKGNYKKYPDWRWLLYVALTLVVFGIIMKIFKIIGLGVTDAIKGGVVILIVAVVIMAASHILAAGSYKKYPTVSWALGVAAALGVFGIAALLLGTQALNPFFYAGLGLILLLSGTILATSYILGAGNYKKYPTLEWNLGVSAAFATFGTAAILLGFNALNPFFYAGLGIVLILAKTIVEVSDILQKGKYDLPGLTGWSASVALLFSVFTPLIILLGAVGAVGAVVEFFGGTNPFDAGRKMLKQIAWTIVDVSYILQKGIYKQGPTEEWAKGIGIALGAFAPVYQMLINNAPGLFSTGGGVGPKEFAEAIKIVSGGIIEAAWYFAINKAAFVNGPPVKWAKGVGLAIGAFAPVYQMLIDNAPGFLSSGGGVGPEDFAKAINVVSRGIIESAKIFAENTAPFEEGKYPSKQWGRGVGAALGAFTPVFQALHEDTGWFTSNDEVITGMSNAIVIISRALVSAATSFSGVGPDAWGAYPTSDWAKGVSKSVSGFMDIFDNIESRGYTIYSLNASASILNATIKLMSGVAKTIWVSKKYFTASIPTNFIKNLSPNILGFAKLGLQLDKMLTSEKTVTTKDSGFLGFGASSTSKTVKTRRDLSLIKDVASQITQVAWILFSSKRFFEISSNLQKWSDAIIGKSNTSANSGLIGKFALLTKWLDSTPGIYTYYKYDPISNVAERMVRVAKILSDGKNFFAVKIDPFYMRKVGQNILDFNYIVNKLAESEKGGFLNKLSSFTDDLLGTDPISKIARRMITLAKGYDAMATSLMKLGKAMRLLNLKSLNQLGGLTKGLTGAAPMPTVSTERPSTRRKFGQTDDGEPIKKKDKEVPSELKRKNHLYYVSQQLERAVFLLENINRSTSTIDEYISLMTKNQITTPKPIGS